MLPVSGGCFGGNEFSQSAVVAQSLVCEGEQTAEWPGGAPQETDV